MLKSVINKWLISHHWAPLDEKRPEEKLDANLVKKLKSKRFETLTEYSLERNKWSRFFINEKALQSQMLSLINRSLPKIYTTKWVTIFTLKIERFWLTSQSVSDNNFHAATKRVCRVDQADL